MTKELKKDIKITWNKKTTEEKNASLDRLFLEITNKAIIAIKQSFAEAYRISVEKEQSSHAISNKD